MRKCTQTLAILVCVLVPAVAAAQQTAPKTNAGHGTDTGASGGTAADTTPEAGDAASMKGKIYDPSLLKNGTANGQSPAVPTGTATRPGTNNTAPTP